MIGEEWRRGFLGLVLIHNNEEKDTCKEHAMQTESWNQFIFGDLKDFFQHGLIFTTAGIKMNISWVVPLPSNSDHQIITFLVGNPYKPSFATITGKGDNPKYI